MIQRRGSTSARGGFTILELLLVVTMIAALAAISVGKTSTILTNWRVTRAAQAMSEELQQGFALVGRNRKPVVMEFDKTTMNLTIRSRPDAPGASPTVFKKRNFGSTSEYKLDAADITFSAYSLEIYPPGLSADSLSISISRQGQFRKIRMLRGGLVQICIDKDATKC